MSLTFVSSVRINEPVLIAFVASFCAAFTSDTSSVIRWFTAVFALISSAAPLTVLIISLVFNNYVKKGKIIFFELGIIVGAFARYIIHGISGMLLWESTFMYSFIIYNLPYLGISTLLCLIVGLFVFKPIQKLKI